jgi:hypothetical protein
MAKADPKNTHRIATIQEEVDALARYIENAPKDAPEKLQRVTTTGRQKHLEDLKGILCTIAKGRKLAEADAKLQAQAIKNKLVRRIDYRRSPHARDLHYGHFVDKNSDLRLCCLIRLTNKIGQGRGFGSRTAAREEAAAIKNISQLEVVERRAFDILKGARRKPRKNSIERQAIQLAEATKVKLSSPRRTGRPKKGKWMRKPDVKAFFADPPEERRFEALKPPLTLTDLVSITAPIIEEFAGKITQQNNAFMALWHIVCAYSEVITRETQRDLRISKKKVQQALSRVRRELRNTISDSNLSNAGNNGTDTKIGPKS